MASVPAVSRAVKSIHWLLILSRNKAYQSKARSKNWDEFAAPNNETELDFVITVCDKAASEVCPVWPGQPITAHWGVEDPAQFMEDAEKARKVVPDVFHVLNRRIQLFVNLPASSLDRLALSAAVGDIGKQK